jgi:uncharacterized hydrophobic protein (TIGR00271 family)
VVHLRIVAPHDLAEQTFEVLSCSPAVVNIIQLPGAAQKPEGDVFLADVAREDASVIVSDLKELQIPERGSIALETVDTSISEVAIHAEKAAAGLPADAVVWEEVEARAGEQTELSASFLVFMVIAVLIASAGIMLDSPILIIGAMVVGPEFGPLAGLSVALVERRRELARRSFMALVVGFPVAITAALVVTLLLDGINVGPESLTSQDHPFTDFISDPDFFSFFVAFLAGAAGILSLTTAKSGALIGVLISVTTIPSAANIGVAAAYGDWSEWRGAVIQLSVNLVCIVAAGVLTLFIQRRLYVKRRREHLHDPLRERAGLPVGRSTRIRSKETPEPQ